MTQIKIDSYDDNYTRQTEGFSAGEVDEEKVKLMLKSRLQAKRKKNYKAADRIRDELRDMGIHMRDGDRTWRLELKTSKATADSKHAAHAHAHAHDRESTEVSADSREVLVREVAAAGVLNPEGGAASAGAVCGDGASTSSTSTAGHVRF